MNNTFSFFTVESYTRQVDETPGLWYTTRNIVRYTMAGGTGPENVVVRTTREVRSGVSTSS